MPVFEIETPQGNFEVEAPDEQTAIEALQKQMPELAQEKNGYLEDMGRSALSGLRQGTEGIVGMIGDASQMTGDASAWIAGKLGAGEGAQDTVRGIARRAAFPAAMNAPTTAQIRGVTNQAVGESYQPQTMPGEYARTVGQFAPAALAGPGSIARNAVVGLGSALASETGGQLTKGTAAEPYARAGGALLGGLAASRIPTPGRRPVLPTARDIKSSAGYQAIKPEMQAARIDQGTYASIVDDLGRVADDFGMVPEQHGAFQAILKRHADAAKTGGASLQDLEILRRSLQNAGKSTVNRSSGELARQMVEKLDDAVTAIPGGGTSVGAGRMVGDTIEDLQAARETWRTGMKAEIVETAMEKAKNTASGLENGIRVEFRKILNNKTLSRMFSDTEKQAMQQVVRGTFKGNLLRMLGTFGGPIDQGRSAAGIFMGGGIGGAVGSAIGGPVGGLIGGAALPAAATMAKAGSNAITRNNAAFVEALVKAGPKAQKLAAEAMMELRAARNLGLVRSGVLAEQALSVSRARDAVNQ